VPLRAGEAADRLQLDYSQPRGRRLHTIGGRTLRPHLTPPASSASTPVANANRVGLGAGNLFDETLVRGNQP